MAKKRPMLELMTQAADLPRDAAPGAPLIELCGNQRAVIENHKGVGEYDCEHISVRLARGSILLTGRNLQLSCLRPGTLVVTGVIGSLSFLPGACP